MAAAYQYIEVVGVSTASVEEAVKTAINVAAKSGKVSWFEVTATRGRIAENTELEFQVTVKCGVVAA